ncbi:MAG: DUF6596 domain-containing protein [Pseudomonadota bacterium]
MTGDKANTQARAQAEHVARASYGRLIAVLAKQSGDIAAAEDALADAFAKAMETWSATGIPQAPEAWLLAVAKNKQRDEAKSAARRTAAGSLNDENFAMSHTPATIINATSADIPDERLKLMFACAHPAIDDTVHTPLMLQTVLGFEATEIASAYLVPSATLAQRLVRAKRKIRDARIPFCVPDRDDMQPRLKSVLEAVYGAYALSWQDAYSADVTRDLSAEALYLAAVIADLLPDEAEALGLAALIAFSMARRDARLDDEGVLVPTDRQDTQRWNRILMRRGMTTLTRASKMRKPGRFQIEAAIQSVHCDRADTGEADWSAIASLYDALVAFTPTLGSAVARAAAVGQAYGWDAGLKALATIDAEDATRYQPYWATAAFLFTAAGDESQAAPAYDKAIHLCTDVPTRRWLERERELAKLGKR